MSRVVTVRAHAKINLGLRVIGVRPDGYHELRTIFQSLALHDTLRLVAATGPVAVTSNDQTVPAGRQNLVWRAAEMLWGVAGRPGGPSGVRVEITKRIPVQSGLGGGSADAAAALRALAQWWRMRPAGPALYQMAARLGADVPYFLSGGTALGSGRGDAICPLVDRPPAWVVIALPPFGVSTSEAFGWYDADRGTVPSGPAAISDGVEGNDLEAPVVRRRPEVGRLVRILRELGGSRSAMSGSGSAVFGLFETRSRARLASRALRRGNWRAIVTRTLARAEYARSSRPQRLARGPSLV